MKDVRCLVLLSLAVAFCASGARARDPWLIDLRPGESAITPSTTRQELIQRYGAANVRDQGIDVGEGEIEPGTVLYPDDPARKIEILRSRSGNELTRLIVGGKASRRHTVHGISLGTSLADLERLNGKPFSLAGFGWDYSGTVVSWRDGFLQKELTVNGRVLLRLDSVAGQTNVSLAEQNQLEGDRDFSSGHPVIQKINPRVYEIVWDFVYQATNPSAN